MSMYAMKCPQCGAYEQGVGCQRCGVPYGDMDVVEGDEIIDALNNEADLSRQLAECREKLEAAEREHAVELENVEDLAKAIGKLSMKVLGYEHYCQSPAELLVRVEDYIDAASERAARVERAGLKLVEDIMDSLPHVDCIADMWLRDGIKKFKRSLEEQNDKD